MQNINVNIVPDSYPQTIRYSQGDVGREFTINVTGFTIPTGATVKIQATKPSGFGFSVAGTVAGNAVTFTTTAVMTDEAGRFPAELKITKDSVVIGTANFIMWGEVNPHPEGTTDGQQGTIIPELTLLVERVEAAASSVLDMEVVANTLPAGSQATYSYDEDLNKATFGIPQGEAGAGAAGVVADAYSSSKTYKVGDYVLHNSNLYRCITAITTAEAFTAAHWTQIVLANDVSDLKTDFNDFIDTFGSDVDTAVDNWLDLHPEATTTVEDGSLTEAKFTEALKLKTIKDYVTPEMFGAKGDGVTDDSAVFQYILENVGGVCLCTKTYYIGQNVYCYDQNVNGDTGAFPKTRFVGNYGDIAQQGSSSTESLLDYQATFIFGVNASFIIKYTSNVKFEYCVFFGDTSVIADESTNILCAIKAPVAPFRKIMISDCYFANFTYAIYGENADNLWSGEHRFENIIFTQCLYCIKFINTGYDTLIDGCVASYSNWFLYLTNCTNAMISNNHSYTKRGSYLRGSAVIVGNYFDDWGDVDNYNHALVIRAVDYQGMTITGNVFNLSERPSDGIVYLIKVASFETGETGLFLNSVVANNVICKNSINGVRPKAVLFDATQASAIGSNYISFPPQLLDGITNDNTITKFANGNYIPNLDVYFSLNSAVGSMTQFYTNVPSGVIINAKINVTRADLLAGNYILVKYNGLPNARAFHDIRITLNDDTVIHTTQTDKSYITLADYASMSVKEVLITSYIDYFTTAIARTPFVVPTT